ncbi:hypothetical protein GCK72_006685 [Caenorhabditis remanei]|uniref:Uncharacterized protein n=1 Tax=Caenorhabditis remanei TaxID=31234 RepID=A0A6A5HJF7_CAERE|nr:hypothetical protein GCK72_006685 [Caenorhabditis remanei]KAF1766727.1 hypothetical protein GCK72_006685 [Caenorhabditis remanei]
MQVFLYFLLFLFPVCYCCNNTNTWVILENIDDSSTLPAFDYQNDTFCVSTKDMTNGMALYMTTKLTDPKEKGSFEQLGYNSFGMDLLEND